MQHAPMTMAALAPEVVFVLAAFLDPREVRAESDQFAHRFRTVAHDSLDRRPIAQAGARPQRVLDVRLERIVDAPHARDSALRVGGIGLVAGRLGQHRNAANRRGLDREDQPGDTAADYEEVAACLGFRSSCCQRARSLALTSFEWRLPRGPPPLILQSQAPSLSQSPARAGAAILSRLARASLRLHLRFDAIRRRAQ